jgi:multidrug efflux pump subunit AcrA (membrane-fusion protein)
MLNPGELAEAGVGRKPMLKLAEIEVLYVEVILPASWYERVAIGDAVTIHTEVPAGASYDATVKVVDPVMDSASGTFFVRLELPNPDYALPAGVRCRVRFNGTDDALAAGAG